MTTTLQDFYHPNQLSITCVVQSFNSWSTVPLSIVVQTHWLNLAILWAGVREVNVSVIIFRYIYITNFHWSFHHSNTIWQYRSLGNIWWMFCIHSFYWLSNTILVCFPRNITNSIRDIEDIVDCRNWFLCQQLKSCLLHGSYILFVFFWVVEILYQQYRKDRLHGL